MSSENLPSSLDPAFESAIAPYIKCIEKLKAEITKRGNDFIVGISAFLNFKIATELAEFIAVAALLEEYDILNRYFAEIELLGQESEQIPSVAKILNIHVSRDFTPWQPTPLHFIILPTTRTMMQDVNKMVRFLAEHGADVNMPASNGSTPLLSTTFAGCPISIMQTLLEIGANPNQISINNGHEKSPLCGCLHTFKYINDDEEIVPFDLEAIEKAKMLLDYGADPNLAGKDDDFVLPFPPLIMAIEYGDTSQPELLELIELLLKKGANPNFTDCYGDTPLSSAIYKNAKTIGELLLLYGAKMPEKSEQSEQSKQSEMPKYETSFNYLLTHSVIPQLMFSDLKYFYENILISPDTMRQFMQKALAHATALATGQSRYEPPYPIEKFVMGIYGKGGSTNPSDETIIVVSFPKFEEPCDCALIAIPVTRTGYYTCEMAVSPIDNKVSYMIGGWEPAGSSFRHNNYGEIPMPLELQFFIDRVIDLAYGSSQNTASTSNATLVVDTNPIKMSDNEKAVEAYKTGTKLMLDNRLDEAEKYLTEAVEHDPTFSQALDHLGIVYRRQGQLEKAEKVYLHALTLDDKNTVPYINLALVYRQMNRTEDTVKMFVKVNEIDPENPESYFGMGALFQEYGQYEKSIGYFHEAMKRYDKQKSNKIYDAMYNQGHNHYELGEYEESLYCYEQAAKAYPNDEILKEHIAEVRKILNKE